MATLPTLIVFPASLHGGHWAAGPRVKPELVSMHTVLRRNGVDVRVLDLENEVGNPGASDRDAFAANATRHLDAALGALSEGPTLVVISCSSSLQYTASLAVAEMVRRLRAAAQIAVTGFHVSARPNDFTFHGAPLDWVILGEPEMALVGLAGSAGEAGPDESGADKARADEAAAAQTGIHGAGVLQAGADEARVHESAADKAGAGTPAGAAGRAASRADPGPRLVEGTPLRHSPANLPDFENFPYTTTGLNVLQVYLSRGCPFPVAACQLRPGSPGWRAFPPEDVRDEIERLSALRPARIDVLDPAFGLDPVWRTVALEQLDRAGGRRPCPVRITARPETFTRSDVDLAYQADLRLELDAGTLSVELLNRTGTIPESLKHVRHTLDLMSYINAKGLLTDVNFVFNQPGETRETAAETLGRLERFVKALPNTTLRFNATSWVYAPYGDAESEIEVPGDRYGTRILHPEWWREGMPSERGAKSVVASTELSDLEGGDESYWRPRFDAIADKLGAKLTGDAHRGIRSHEWVGTGATGVPHGFWAEPRWH